MRPLILAALLLAPLAAQAQQPASVTLKRDDLMLLSQMAGSAMIRFDQAAAAVALQQRLQAALAASAKPAAAAAKAPRPARAK